MTEPASFSTFVEVWTEDHPWAQGPVNGGPRPTSHLLRDVLAANDGRYEIHLDIPDALGPADTDTPAGQRPPSYVQISLDHLRDRDPDTTRIVYGFTYRDPSHPPTHASSTEPAHRRPGQPLTDRQEGEAHRCRRHDVDSP